jgi:Zn finger protein HypA/HybF involved in hydrogenase expression
MALKLDTKHLHTTTQKSMTNDRIFVRNSTADRSQVKRRLLRDLRWPYTCHACSNVMFETRDGLPFWLDKPVTLQLEHRNGNNTDNRIENLDLFCPLCHSQTSTYSGRNSLAARAKRARALVLSHS